MDNSKNISPCQVAAFLDAICNNGNWTIYALNASVKYDPPFVTNRTANFCTCSWASYNLISACIACQGFPEQISAWSPYSAECAGLLSNTYFPSNFTLPEDVFIPYWAGEDPTKWPGETFNVANAKQIAAEGKPDLTKSSPPKKRNIGAIVGGVIGGVVVIFIALGIAFWMLRQQRQLTQSKAGLPTKPDHMRSISDVTTGSNVKSVGYTTLTSSPMVHTNPPTGPTILTHGSSIRFIPFVSSIAGSIAPYGTASASRPPDRRTPTVPLSSKPEDVIVPFTLPPTFSNLDRKQANGAPIYDPHTAPPPNALRTDIKRPVTPTQRARYNPPPYEAPSADGPSSGRPHHRGKQACTETATLERSPGASGPANVAGVVTSSPPFSMRPAQRNNNRQPPPTPTEASFSARDVA
ncbi:hypothetical protein M413DRAFT_447428 [Hebeloma cylindrosporum]|uniref:Transmembrane protein n=1 Tax=Hebeloma cylindrosporum TaxID=76867 RepID=A0A0C3BR03_HEBCY|nr:hypothetical protein M413DRAFT_447428 [Hebeloma cylindrosporum h7]